MQIELDFQSPIPIYQQLRFQIMQLIATGRLAPGTSLPSVRKLGEDLGIHFHTVNKSYSLLKQDGYIISHRHNGMVVADTLPTLGENFLTSLEDQISPIVAEAFCAGIDRKDFLDWVSGIYRRMEIQAERGWK